MEKHDTKGDQDPPPSVDRKAYRERNAVPRLLNRFRCVVTRYEKWAASYRAMATVAAVLPWLSSAQVL